MQSVNRNVFACLAIAGFWGLAGMQTYRANNPVAWGSVGACVLAAEAVRRRSGIGTDSEWLEGSLEALGAILEEAQTIANEYTAPVRRQIEANHLWSAMPFADLVRDTPSDDWIESFGKRSAMAVGRSGDGKTFLLRYLLARYLVSNPGGEVLILDRDYGCGHGDTVNTWMGLPEHLIKTDFESIFVALHDAWEEIEHRANLRKPRNEHRPLLIICDEWPQVYAYFKKNQQEDLMRYLRAIFDRGLKQNVWILLGSQHATVEATGLTQSDLRKLDAVILGQMAREPKGLDSLVGLRPKEVENTARRLPDSGRVCLLWKDAKLTAEKVPELPQEEPQIAPEVAPTELGPTAPADPIAHLKTQAVVDAKAGGMSKTFAWVTALGMEKKNQRRSNPEYVAFADWYANLDPSNFQPLEAGGESVGGGEGSQPEPVLSPTTKTVLEEVGGKS